MDRKQLVQVFGEVDRIGNMVHDLLHPFGLLSVGNILYNGKNAGHFIVLDNRDQTGIGKPVVIGNPVIFLLLMGFSFTECRLYSSMVDAGRKGKASR